MIVCPQCHGSGNTIPINLATNVPGGTTFTAPTQVPESLCNYCLGNGYFTGAGS